MDRLKDILLNTFTWFQKAVPQPSSANFHTQTGVHFEEVVEMLDEIVALDRESGILQMRAREALHEYATFLKGNDNVICVPQEKLIGFLDALCDQVVTASGVAHMVGYKFLGAMKEVNRSNWSKFENDEPIFNENNKIMKGKNYSPADLEPYLPQ